MHLHTRLLFVSSVWAFLGCNQADPLVTCDPNPAVVTTATLQTQVFNACRTCHNQNDTYADLSAPEKSQAMVDKASTFSKGVAGSELKLVKPKDLANSSLWLKLNGGTSAKLAGPKMEMLGGIMPPTGALSATDLKAVKDWICGGAKAN